jgi:hypothetical protein
MNDDASSQFGAADIAVNRAAEKIERTLADLLKTTLPLDRVATDYVIEMLIDALIERNPQALDYLNRWHGEGTVRLTNAFMDWRDHWVKR